MNHSALRLPSLALATTAFISLASASPGSAQVNTQMPPQRESAAVHQKGSAERAHGPMGPAAQAGPTMKVHGSPMGDVRNPTMHAATREMAPRTVRGTNARTAGGTTVGGDGHWVWRGGQREWQSYSVTGAGYAYEPGTTGVVYSGTYGVAWHSCWWYRHFDPANMPRWCPRYYGSSYGYRYGYSAPSYSYSAPAYSYGYRYGESRNESTRVTSTRVANVSGARVESRTHGVTPGGAHVAVTRPAETGAQVRSHAQAGAEVGAHSPGGGQSGAHSPAGAHVRTQTSP